MELKSPAEILAYTSDVGVIKTRRGIPPMLILAFLAGAFIAIAAASTNMAAFNLLDNEGTYGLGKVAQGVFFGTALLLVVTTGTELFTGNTLIIIAVLDRKAALSKMFLNWVLVYIGNLLGGLFVAWLISISGLFETGGGLYGGITIKIAAGKTSLPFGAAFALGLLCNWLVCLAVWISYGSKDIVGKAVAIFPIIGIFVIAGFEHSIANMYYIPAGLFAMQSPRLLAMSGISAEKLADLNWFNFFVKNLIPVTLGNIAGGSVMVGVLNWLVFGKTKKT